MLTSNSKMQIKNLFFQKIIKIPLLFNIALKIYTIENFNILFIENSTIYKYIILPKFFHINIVNNFILCQFFNNKFYYSIYKFFFKFISNIKVFYKQVLIRGSGFKFIFHSKIKQLEFKLGFTHKKYLFLPSNTFFKIIIQKPILILLDYNAVRLGNYTNKIKICKVPNIYSGRGIWDYKQKKKLKIIKK